MVFVLFLFDDDGKSATRPIDLIYFIVFGFFNGTPNYKLVLCG